jgi:hypothetical protein
MHLKYIPEKVQESAKPEPGWLHVMYGMNSIHKKDRFILGQSLF